MKVSTEDATEISQLCAVYAVKMSQGDVQYILDNVLTEDGSYSAFGETYNREDWPALVAAAPSGLFLTGEPAIQVDGDTGTGEVPLMFVDQTNHKMRIGWYTDTYVRTDDGWRLRTRKMTFLRKHGGADSGNPHDPRRPTPASGDS